MEVVADLLDRFDLNRRWQLSMQGADQFFRIMFPVAVEVKALTVGMHACIGAPAAMDLDLCGKDL